MKLTRPCSIFFFAGLLCASSLLRAQTVLSIRAGLIYAVQGDVEVDGKKPHLDPPKVFPQLKDGQPILTTSGRAEILLNSQSVLWIGRDSRLYFEDTALESTLAVLEQGTAMIEVRDVPGGIRMKLRAGDTTVAFPEKGLYRIEYDPETDSGRVQVLGGRAVTTGTGSLPPKPIDRDRELALPFKATDFPKKMASLKMDGFHWWASFQSLQIDRDNRHHGPSNWSGFSDSEHPYFDVRYQDNQGSAAIQYLNYQKAGLLYFHVGNVLINGQSPRQVIRPISPFLPDGAQVVTGGGRAEIFLGSGVTARLDQNSCVKLIDHSVDHPAIALTHGAMILEVAKSGEDSKVQVRLGETITTVRRNGLYHFDAVAGSLKVWDGETATEADNARPVRTRSGQTLDLATLAEPQKFDRQKAQDSLFAWSAQRSFMLFTIADNTMADWTRGTFMDLAMHDVYQERAYLRRRRHRTVNELFRFRSRRYRRR